jgi:hypothetical protein
MGILEIDSNATDVYITLDFSKLHPYLYSAISLEDVIARKAK